MAKFSSFMARLRMLLVLGLTVLLAAACGGGGDSPLAGVGSGGTGFGVTSGFGSLIVDGMRHDDSAASYWSEQEQGSAMAMAPTGATVGQSVEFSYDGNGNIRSALISPELVGSVTAVGSDSVTLLGTRVFINTDAALAPVTRLVGYASLADIKLGDRIEVHGLLKTDAQGVLSVQATLIVLQAPAAGLRLTGYVTQYNAGAGSFVIGANSVKVGAALISPAGAALADGELVTVWSASEPVGNNISASVIRVKGLAGVSQNVTLSGPISSFVSAASFKVRNLTVDASQAQIAPSGATLGADKYVVVVGSFDAASNKLSASRVTVFTAAAPTQVELHGTVANFVSASSFTLRGVVLDASAATFSGGTAAQLANGVYVEVHGTVVNNVVQASSVAIQALSPLQAPTGAVIDVSGTVTAYDAVSGSYSMTLASGATLHGKLGSSMFYNNGTAANLAVGQTVTVNGMLAGGMLSTAVLNFTPTSVAPSSGSLHMEGIAYNVTPTSLMLNGVLIHTNGVVVQRGGMMGGGRTMMSGSTVAVDLLLIGGQYVATAITLLH